jgi:hypothetical protein
MRAKPFTWIACSLVAVAVAGCDADKDGGRDSKDLTDGGAVESSGLRWFTTCGDPVCQSPGPTPANPCTDQQEGAPCSNSGASCDIGTCGAQLLCADADPKQGGCPISRRAAKTEIRYLDAGERSQLLQDLMGIRLATYQYNGNGTSRRLGFIIDDVGPGYVVLPSGDRVDVYGFASMAVAAIQAQELRIAEIEAKLAALQEQSSAVCAQGAR